MTISEEVYHNDNRIDNKKHQAPTEREFCYALDAIYCRIAQLSNKYELGNIYGWSKILDQIDND